MLQHLVLRTYFGTLRDKMLGSPEVKQLALQAVQEYSDSGSLAVCADHSVRRDDETTAEVLAMYNGHETDQPHGLHTGRAASSTL